MDFLAQFTLDGHSTSELLGCVILLQSWIVKKLYGLDKRVGIISSHCKHCRGLDKEKE